MAARGHRCWHGSDRLDGGSATCTVGYSVGVEFEAPGFLKVLKTSIRDLSSELDFVLAS